MGFKRCPRYYLGIGSFVFVFGVCVWGGGAGREGAQAISILWEGGADLCCSPPPPPVLLHLCVCNFHQLVLYCIYFLWYSFLIPVYHNVNPCLSSGLVLPYQLDESIPILGVSGGIFLFFILFYLEWKILYCLPRS